MRDSQKALFLGLLTTGGLTGTGGQIEGYDIDRWLSYSVGELRIRPQFDASFTFNDNIFYAPNDSTLEISQSILVFPQSATGNYTYFSDPRSPIYNGLLQYQVYSDFRFQQRVDQSAPFSSSVYPFPTVPVGTGQFGGVFGFVTNSLQFSPRTSDVIATASPGVKLQYGSEEFNFLNLEYNLDSVRYLDQGIAPVPMHRIRNQFRVEKSRIRVDGTSGFNYVSSFLGGGSNQRGQLVDRWNGSVDAKITYDSSSKTDVYLNGAYNFTDYSFANIYSVNTWRAGLGATYKPTERIFLFTEGHYGQTALTPASTNLIGAPYSQTFGGFVGLRGKFTERIEGTIRGGYELREFPNVRTGGSYSVPAAEVSVSYLLRDTTQLTFGYSRRTDVAPQVARQALTYNSLRFGIKQVLGSSAKWVGFADAAVNLSDFGDTPLTVLTTLDELPGTGFRVLNRRLASLKRSDLLTTYSVGVSYSPRAWLKSSLAYEFEKYSVTFDDPGLQNTFLPSYDSHRVMFNVQVGF